MNVEFDVFWKLDDWLVVTHWESDILLKSYEILKWYHSLKKYEYLLDPINIYCLCGTIGIIGVDLQSKKSYVMLCSFCLLAFSKDVTDDWDNN